MILAEAWLTLLWVDLVISLLPYSRWRGWLVQPLAPVDVPAAADDNALDLEGIARLCAAAARHHLRPMNCLRRTLALRRMLRRRRLDAQVHIGVRRKAAVLEAHAWLSWRGRVLNDSADVEQRYAELQADQWPGRGW
ncbi:MAG: lasso peptide biosynthesis B2 protein [Parahaliea sp.]